MSSFLIAAVPLAIVAVTALVVLWRTRRRATRARPGREPSAFVILEGNAWESCAVDDLREPWARFTTEPVRGFCGVSPGRHRIRTTTSAGDAVLDVVLYPGEVLAWRLDPERARWEPHDLDAETRASLDATPVSAKELAPSARPKLPGWLVHLRTTANLARARVSGAHAMPAREEEGTDRVRKRLGKLVGRAETEVEERYGDLVSEARALGEAIVGRAMTKKEMRGMAGAVRDSAVRMLHRGDLSRAMRVVGLGLAVLPGDPELMVIAGCVLSERGEVDEALRAFNAALERDRCLEAEDIARAMRARLDLRTRLGRTVRV